MLPQQAPSEIASGDQGLLFCRLSLSNNSWFHSHTIGILNSTSKLSHSYPHTELVGLASEVSHSGHRKHSLLSP